MPLIGIIRLNQKRKEKILARLLLLTAISIFIPFLLNPSEVFSWYCNVEII